jgi:L-fucose mutarotase
MFFLCYFLCYSCCFFLDVFVYFWFVQSFEQKRYNVLKKITMLKGISPIISPELLKVLAEMGHGEEIIISDAHFPAYSFNKNVLRADGSKVPDMLSAILPLFELDDYVPHPLVMMAAVEGDELDPHVETRYLKSIHNVYPNVPNIERIDRFEFYERAKGAFAVIITGETGKYGNILLKKGVTPVV